MVASWANTLGHSTDSPSPEARGSFPVDVSVYGVCDVVGNSRDWCTNGWRKELIEVVHGLLRREVSPGDTVYRESRGGAWTSTRHICRLAARFADKPESRFTNLGTRTMRVYPAVSDPAPLTR